MAGPAPYDHLFKILLIGDAAVGKSSIMLRFTDGSFVDQIHSTIGVDFKVCSITLSHTQACVRSSSFSVLLQNLLLFEYTRSHY